MKIYKAFLLTLSFGLCSAVLKAQSGSRTFKIDALPDSAEVTVNGKLAGYTPITFKQDFDFKKYYQYDVKISKRGFEDKIFSYNSLPEEKTIVLEKNLMRKKNGPDSLPEFKIGFDKLIYDIKDGDKIGEFSYYGHHKSYYWNSNDQGTTGYNKIAEDKLSEYGLTVIRAIRLFDSQESSAPDLMLGAEMKSINIHNVEGHNTIECDMTIEWQFFSLAKGKVIGKITTNGKYQTVDTDDEQRSSSSGAFGNALARLLYSQQFMNLVRDFKKINAGNKLTRKLEIKKYTVPKFNDNAEMVNASLGSVVTVKAEDELSFGSGFILSEDGYVITNYHVVRSAPRMTVVFSNGFTFTADVVAYDEDFDLAVLKLPGAGFKPMALGNSDSIRVGADVVAIGTPKDLKLNQTVTKGIISGKRNIDNHNYLQTDVITNPGNSGGPLINSKGEVVGVMEWRRKDAEGLNFAIPINVAVEKMNIVWK